MIPLTLADLAVVVGGDLADPADAQRRIDTVTIDSRTAAPGALFVPLAGERTDGHRFVGDAVARGATGYLRGARAVGVSGDAGPAGAVVVDDPADGLLGLGAWVRSTVAPTVVAVTGSSGKTTAKDLIAAAVGAGRTVVANPGSFNNELGVPLTCCLLAHGTEVLVAEVGARGVGHIADLAPVLDPDVAVVTTVGAAHLERFGDVDAVARAKAELVEALRHDGIAILNADDPRVLAMAAVAPGRVVTFGTGPDADWRAEDLALDALARPTFTVAGLEVTLPLPGAHNVGSALAALAVADVLGVPLTAAGTALRTATVSPWRMQLGRTGDGVVVLNDAYNANPASMAAGLATLAGMTVTGRRWAVLGRMAELGAGSPAAHADVGRLCAQLGIDGLVVVDHPEVEPLRAAAAATGRYDDTRLLWAADAAAAARLVRAAVGPGDAVLVKASRAAGLERVAAALLTEGAP